MDKMGSPVASGARARTLDTAPTIIIIASAHLTYDSSSTPLEAMLDTSPSSNFFCRKCYFSGESTARREKEPFKKKLFATAEGTTWQRLAHAATATATATVKGGLEGDHLEAMAVGAIVGLAVGAAFATERSRRVGRAEREQKAALEESFASLKMEFESRDKAAVAMEEAKVALEARISQVRPPAFPRID